MKSIYSLAIISVLMLVGASVGYANGNENYPSGSRPEGMGAGSSSMRVSSGFTMSHMETGSGKKLTTEQLSCVRTLLAKRESAILTAMDAFSDKIHDALILRASQLDAAWGITEKEDRKSARIAAWETWKKSQKTIRGEYRLAAKKAWEDFRSGAQTCKVSEAAAEQAGGELQL